jgi:energy-coupling factor transport system ATP-binding protein
MIRISDLKVRFSDGQQEAKNVLDGINLTIQEGESVAIMGANGSGKTTFARCLNALILPTSGSVSIDEKRTDDEDNLVDIRRKVGMVFQNPDNQIVSATIEREIAFGLENLGVPYEEMRIRVEDMLNTFSLQKYRHNTPHYLSGGEKQRLAIAAVMAMQPGYLILDEPTSLLDPRGRNNILKIVKDLHGPTQLKKITTVLITQFAEEAQLADRLLVFNKGQIIFDDTPRNVFDHTKEIIKIGLEPPTKVLFEHIMKQDL